MTKTNATHASGARRWRSWLVVLGLTAAGCSSSPEATTPPNPAAGSMPPGMTATPPMGPAVAAPPMGPATAPGAPIAGMMSGGAAGAAASPGVAAPAVPPTPGGAAGAGAVEAPKTYPEGALPGECPSGFMPSSGRNTGFMTKAGVPRDFIVYLPPAAMLETPRPVYLAITGTVQEEDQFANRDSMLAPTLNAMGWIVLAPVRHCSMSGRSCYSEGDDGWIWYPWNDGSLDPKWAQEMGPDPEFAEEMTRCAAMAWQVDQRRIYIGGISAGGSFTYRNVTYNSDFFAGGVPGSGMWYTDSPTGPLDPTGGVMLMEEDPERIIDGGCCPRPIAEKKLDPMIVVDLWGGPQDLWTNPMGNGRLTFDYRQETQAASNWFATQENVVYLACSGPQGHNWPGSALSGGANARDFNTWMATVLLSHPKGTPVSEFTMPTSFPQGYSCVRGRFTDHY
jgi:poly(3-hydroxybutyrate) depolymerase